MLMSPDWLAVSQNNP